MYLCYICHEMHLKEISSDYLYCFVTKTNFYNLIAHKVYNYILQ